MYMITGAASVGTFYLTWPEKTLAIKSVLPEALPNRIGPRKASSADDLTCYQRTADTIHHSGLRVTLHRA